ncbi:MAG: hypothetical protein R3B46_05195 [Phycisphaerales bacterium]
MPPIPAPDWSPDQHRNLDIKPLSPGSPTDAIAKYPMKNAHRIFVASPTSSSDRGVPVHHPDAEEQMHQSRP